MKMHSIKHLKSNLPQTHVPKLTIRIIITTLISQNSIPKTTIKRNIITRIPTTKRKVISHTNSILHILLLSRRTRPNNSQITRRSRQQLQINDYHKKNNRTRSRRRYGRRTRNYSYSYKFIEYTIYRSQVPSPPIHT